jgi:hypothetical protein
MVRQKCCDLRPVRKGIIVERIKRGLAHARANGKIGGERYKLSPADQIEAIRLIQIDTKTQGQVAHIYKVDRSTPQQ